MWIDNIVLKEDLERIVQKDSIPWEQLKGKTILVTGGTGLIGYNLICALAFADIKMQLGLQVVALVRDVARATDKFHKLLKDWKQLQFIKGCTEETCEINMDIDFIVHGASPTASKFFIESPVETIKTAVTGTMNMLDLAKEKKVTGFVYLSSMEIYGSPKTEDKLTEEDLGYLNPLNVRNCYPEGKRMCEALVASYASEYQVQAKTIRLAQTFGAGVDKSDVRVFAEFARCANDGKDIVLLTDVASKRAYLYTMDAVSAILTVLLKGKPGCAYNAANEATYCSVKEMAELVAKEISQGKSQVIIKNDKEASKKYPPAHFYNLCTTRLQELGWKAEYSLVAMYHRMMKSQM